MADGALTPAAVDIPVGSLNQRPPDHAGPTGRLVGLFDVEINQYATGGDGKRILLDPRRGFSSLSNVLRNCFSGVVESGTWLSPSYMFALGEQLLSICTDRPRVYNGTDWTHYGTRRIVTQKLTESVMHATNNTIAAPDHAWIAGVTCSVWTEQTINSTGTLSATSVWVGFRSDDGAWVRVPTLLRTALASDPDYVLGKVVQDGANFWVFYNSGTVEVPLLIIQVYDTSGVLLAQTNTARFWSTAPGYWDVYGSVLTGVYLAQPAAYNPAPFDVHVNVKKFTYAASVITTAINSALSTAHCMGPVAWLTMDLAGTRTYLATVNTSNKLWCYELSSALAITHTYDVTESPSLLPDSLTGWAEEEGAPNGNRSVHLSYSQLAGPAASTGPTFDPATRFTKSVKTTFAGATTTDRKTQSVIQQSRAYAINGEYYAKTYYQSGSGQLLPSAAASVTWTSGDYFIGDVEQPLSFSSGGTYGAPFAATPASITTGSAGYTGKLITGTDTVATFIADGTPGIVGVPLGTPVLKWTFANATPSSGHIAHILKVNASSIATANAQWDIYGSPSSGVFYTAATSRSGTSVITGTFTATGTVDVIQMVSYQIGNLYNLMPQAVRILFNGGSVTISGASNPGNNGTFTIVSRDSLLQGLDTSLPLPNGFLWTAITTQVTEGPGGSAVITPQFRDDWFFTGNHFTTADTNSFLRVTDNPITSNNADHLDVASIPAPGGSSFVVDATQDAATVAQLFATPFPTCSLNLKDESQRFNLHLASVTFDYTYINALVSIANSAVSGTINGIYKITRLIDSHTVFVEATNGTTGQRSETFVNTIAISIQRATNVQPETQPTWFVTPLTGSQPQVGCFEKGLAFADWRFDGQSSAAPDFDGQNRYRFALSSTSNPFGTIRQVVLPFRVANFTQVSIATVGATPLDIANVSSASTVGLKIFRAQGTGQGTGDARKLLIPGLLASEFTLSGFNESNVNVGPEAPFVVSEATDGSTNFALIPGQTYTYQATIARTLENGDVVESLPSPPIQVTLTGTNNVVNLGGRLISPLDTGGVASAGLFGLTNHGGNVEYRLYRSVVIDGVPSTQLHLITNPAAPNALYAGGVGSGFSFPNTFTWNYRDENPDAGISATQTIYAGTLGQGIAPHYPCPAFSHATTWGNRRWVVGYDGAVWMSAELQEGEDPWFFPGFRYPFPEEDPAVCVVGFENYLFMFCAKSVWRIQTTELPNATLTSGAMPTPVRLPIAMGCSGFAVACTDFVAYSSSADSRQVWAITRDLANVYLSEPLSAFNLPIDGMTVDGQQRLLVTAGDQFVRVFDPVAKEWYTWSLTTVPIVIGVYQGRPTFQDFGFVNQQSPSAFVDTRNAIATPIALSATFSSLTFAQVRAVKRLWEIQIIGSVVGACKITATIGYPDDDPSTPTTFGPTSLTSDPVLLAINPMIEDSGAFDVTIAGSYVGVVTPGKCFSLEMLTCEVGLDPKQGLRKLPDGFRLLANP